MTEKLENFRLPKYASPTKYKIELSPDLEDKSFSGNVDLSINILEKTKEISLNVAELEISSINISSDQFENIEVINWDIDNTYEIMKIHLSEILEPGEINLSISYTGILNDKLRGFYHSTFSDANGITQSIATTQFESTDARRAFPCFDEPEYKSVFSVSLIIKKDLFCVSNASIKNVEENHTKQLKKIDFENTIPMSTYLVAFIVGPFEASKAINVGGTDLRIIFPKGKGHLCDFALELGKYSLEYFSDYYKIPYPGDKLDMIAIPDFAFGAMENLGCITYREALLLVNDKEATSNELIRIADVIAHEIAHMWFGDLVTMKWWNGIWLNEAFATFMATKAVADYKEEWNRWAQFSLEKSMAMDIDSLNTTRPIEYPVISPSDADGMFDLITYEKGGSILRMLEQFLGEEIFRDGVSLYLSKHSYGNTETDDLWDSLEKVSNQPVKEVMDSWIFQAGHPMITYSFNDENLSVAQKTFRYLKTSDDTTWGVPLFIKYSSENQNKEIKFLLNNKDQKINLGKNVDNVFLNSNAFGFYRTDTKDLELLFNIDKLSSEEKYSILDDYWALLLNGSKKLPDFLNFSEQFSNEDDPDILTLLYSCFSNLNRNLSDKSYLHSIVEKVFSKTLDNLDNKEKRSIRETQALAVCFRAMATICKDSVIISKSKKILNDYLSNNSEYEPDIISSVISINASNGDSSLFEDYVNFMNNAKTPQDEVRFQRSLSLFKGDKEIEKLYDLILNNKIRSQDSPYILASTLNNEAVGWKTWNFIEKNWEELSKRFPENSIVRMLSGIRSLNQREYLNHLKTFFADGDRVKQGKLQLDQHLEKLEINVNFRESL